MSIGHQWQKIWWPTPVPSNTCTCFFRCRFADIFTKLIQIYKYCTRSGSWPPCPCISWDLQSINILTQTTSTTSKIVENKHLSISQAEVWWELVPDGCNCHWTDKLTNLARSRLAKCGTKPQQTCQILWNVASMFLSPFPLTPAIPSGWLHVYGPPHSINFIQHKMFHCLARLQS